LSSIYACYLVEDSSKSVAYSAPDEVIVNGPFRPGAITPASPSAQVGQFLQLTANPTGGTLPYHYQWYTGPSSGCSSDGAISGGTTSTLVVTPPDSTYYCYVVTDSSTGEPALRVTSPATWVTITFRIGFTTSDLPSGTEWYANVTGTTLTDSIPVGNYPFGVAYDSGKGEVFVTDSASGIVSVISDSTNSIITGAGAGTGPTGVAYDPPMGELFVTNYGSDTVSVISDATDTVVATVPVGSSPYAVVFDSASREVFVANLGSNNVSVISDASNRVVATVPVGADPYGLAFDTAMDQVYVANSGSDNVSIISDATNRVVATVPVGVTPYGLAFDPNKREVFVSNVHSDNVTIISDTTTAVIGMVSVGGGPRGLAYDPQDQLVFAADSATDNVTVISGATNGVVGTVQVATFPNGVGYDPVQHKVFVTNMLSASVSVISIGKTSIESSGTSFGFSGPDGTYSYVVGVAFSGGKAYSAPPGAFQVSGSSEEETLAFAPVHPVTFKEKGLPLTTEWWVNITGGVSENTTATSLKVWLAPGQYVYTVASANKNYMGKAGTLTVKAGAASKSVKFALVTFVVTITESGLPSGAKWCILITGTKNHCTTKPLLTMMEPNGTYSYLLTTTKVGYTGVPGSFTVAGAPKAVTVTFTG